MAETIKADYLQECMTETKSIGRVPIDQFNMEMCRLCGNRQCARSALNNSAFDKRAKNWKLILFDEVPRARDDDPRYERIRAKNFISFQPRDSLVDSKPYEIRETLGVPVARPEAPRVILATPEAPIEQTTPVVPLQSPSAVPVQILNKPLPQEPRGTEMPPNLGNTPFSQGTVLKPQENEIIIQPGGSFTFGSDE